MVIVETIYLSNLFCDDHEANSEDYGINAEWKNQLFLSLIFGVLRDVYNVTVWCHFFLQMLFQSVYSCHASKYSMQQYGPLKYVFQRIFKWSNCVIEWPVFNRMLELECHCNCTQVESLLTDDRQRVNIMALAFKWKYSHEWRPW